MTMVTQVSRVKLPNTKGTQLEASQELISLARNLTAVQRARRRRHTSESPRSGPQLCTHVSERVSASAPLAFRREISVLWSTLRPRLLLLS